MAQIKTINLSGKQYAQVKDRIKVFWEENPNGTINIEAIPMPDSSIIMKSTICRDANEKGGCATGQALGKLDENKAFEKLESIANGRALANLGYLANGEIASLDEMQEFLEHKEQKKNEKIDEAIGLIKKSKTLDGLKKAWVEIDVEIQKVKSVLDLKNKLKTELS